MKTFLLSLILVGCGTAPETDPATGTASNTSTATNSSPASAAITPPKDVTVQYEKVGEQYAIALDDQSLLPVCNAANDRQLAYTRKENKFFACETSVWTEIDVQGQAGATGTAGAQGPIGPKGDAGTAGAKGDPGQPVDPNQWNDPITNAMWLIGVEMTDATLTLNPTVCQNGWALPTEAVAITAMQHGLGATLHGLDVAATGIWTSTYFVSSGASVRSYVAKNASGSNSPDNTYAAPQPVVACVKGN